MGEITERKFIVTIIEEDIGGRYAENLKGNVAIAMADYFAIDEDISFSVEEME